MGDRILSEILSENLSEIGDRIFSQWLQRTRFCEEGVAVAAAAAVAAVAAVDVVVDVVVAAAAEADVRFVSLSSMTTSDIFCPVSSFMMFSCALQWI
jgi:hypothetical protein